MMRSRSLSLSILFLPFFLLPSILANGNYNYNAYNYDMAPTFTPDGRLLQVEYASSASELSTPILALQIQENTLALVALKSPSTPQHRILILPGDLVVGLSGVLADSLALVQLALQEVLQHYRSFATPMTALQFTRALADACQKHSFGGGIRPFGATLLVTSSEQTNLLYQTDPSGAIVQAPPDSSPLRWVVGGSPNVQRQLRKSLDSFPNAATPADVLVEAARALIKETKGSTKGTSLEIVVLSSEAGVQRLTQSEIDSILQRI